jgi:hypothetical protein
MTLGRYVSPMNSQIILFAISQSFALRDRKLCFLYSKYNSLYTIFVSTKTASVGLVDTRQPPVNAL